MKKELTLLIRQSLLTFFTKWYRIAPLPDLRLLDWKWNIEYLYAMSPVSSPRYSLVIPAYNEEKRIASLFESIRQFDGELIVVCDGNDGTADVVETIAEKPSFTLYPLPAFPRSPWKRWGHHRRACRGTGATHRVC